MINWRVLHHRRVTRFLHHRGVAGVLHHRGVTGCQVIRTRRKLCVSHHRCYRIYSNVRLMMHKDWRRLLVNSSSITVNLFFTLLNAVYH